MTTDDSAIVNAMHNAGQGKVIAAGRCGRTRNMPEQITRYRAPHPVKPPKRCVTSGSIISGKSSGSVSVSRHIGASRMKRLRARNAEITTGAEGDHR